MMSHVGPTVKRFNMIYMSIPGGARGKKLRRIALHIYWVT